MADGKGHGCVHSGRRIREASVPAEAGLSSLKRLTMRDGRVLQRDLLLGFELSRRAAERAARQSPPWTSRAPGRDQRKRLQAPAGAPARAANQPPASRAASRPAPDRAPGVRYSGQKYPPGDVYPPDERLR